MDKGQVNDGVHQGYTEKTREKTDDEFTVRDRVGKVLVAEPGRAG